MTIYDTLTSNDKIRKYGKKESNAEDDRPCWAIKVSWIASANQSYTILIDGPAVNLKTNK